MNLEWFWDGIFHTNLQSSEIGTKRKIFAILQFLQFLQKENQTMTNFEKFDDLSTIFPLICDISLQVC